MAVVTPPAAPVSPSVGGGARHFSAQLGAWVKPLHTDEPARQRSVPRAAKRRPGHVTLSQRGKVWLAVAIWCALTWGGLAWAVASLYRGGA